MNVTAAGPWSATAAVAAIVLVFYLRERAKRRDRREQVEHVQILSESHCPYCSSVYGMRAALQAFYGGTLPNRAPFSAEWWRELKPMNYGLWPIITCPDCGEREAYDLARRAILPPPIGYELPPGAEWGEAVCASCGARKRHWADHKNWRCARCHEPLGEAPDGAGPES